MKFSEEYFPKMWPDGSLRRWSSSFQRVEKCHWTRDNPPTVDLIMHTFLCARTNFKPLSSSGELSSRTGSHRLLLKWNYSPWKVSQPINSIRLWPQLEISAYLEWEQRKWLEIWFLLKKKYIHIFLYHKHICAILYTCLLVIKPDTPG